MKLLESLMDRADEIESWPDKDHMVMPTGPDAYTAELLRAAAREIQRLSGERMIQMLHGVPVTMQLQQGDN